MSRNSSKMLTGRESLIRLVGKRRRFLPNRQSLLAIAIQGSLNLCTDNDRVISTESERRFSQSKMAGLTSGEDEKSPLEISIRDWVTCPVCGSRVRGEDCLINSHLDACLSSGKKRKMTQLTLLELNFCSQTSSLVQNAVINSENSVAVEENDSNLCKSLWTTKSVPVKNGMASSTGKPTNGDRINLAVGPSSLPLKDGVSTCDTMTTVDDISGVILKTSIVGRRFSIVKDLNQGAKISLLRDPDNTKDPNAIKVLLADCTPCKVLGFLPRELARPLSPLIEKYSLIFEGHVTSVPKLSLDAVPIQIVCCKKVISHGDRDHSDVKAFTSLWKNVLHAVESAKNCASSATKYQQNFCLLMQEVLRSNHHIFTDDEKNFMESFTSLSDDSQRLFVRLYTRKGPWFRVSSISYPEVSDSKQAINDLSAIGYICSFADPKELQNNDMKEILNLLTISKLREITYLLKKNSSPGTRKQDLIATLLSTYKDKKCLSLPIAIFDRTGMCIKISSKAESLIWRVERLFFLNGDQDLSAFLLVDLGIVKYPTYCCNMSEQIFSTRSDLLAYEEAIEVAQIMDESLEENNNELVLRCIEIADSRMSNSSAKATQSMAIFLSRFSASWVYSKVVFLGISFLEHERRYKDAVNLLKQLLACFPCDGRRGYWTLRLSIDLEHMGCSNESLSVAEDGLLDPWVRAGSRMALQRRVLRLGKPPRRWKAPSFVGSIRRRIKEVHILGRPLNCEIGKKSRFYGENGEQCGVEQLALQYYAGEGGGWHGVHAESGIWLTIFGLLMWDVIFSDVPNVFHNRFQTAPLDLETDGFYPVRKSLIETHLQKIQDGMAEEIVITSWELHSGTACLGVDWGGHSLSELRAVVTCIGGPCLASLCRHLALDYRSWSSGMPDLLLWRFHGEYRGEAKLVEVKGPKDRLSEQQQAWLLLLMDCGFDTEVCKVKPMPSVS
ncbi:fanconi-associated nuclease 1 homolog isoform X2 [Hevea brasiliensis]|uniref:fanconi-associated nuclease 1 homolog isoform X2 n=1 Tax=Hevea brasiliensis TaxID=3981 RepID=UPI0025F44F87|nr:fanconi-associated nuclease 1 homolog isoform X2 [Hevea brasiliensis]